MIKIHRIIINVIRIYSNEYPTGISDAKIVEVIGEIDIQEARHHLRELSKQGYIKLQEESSLSREHLITDGLTPKAFNYCEYFEREYKEVEKFYYFRSDSIFTQHDLAEAIEYTIDSGFDKGERNYYIANVISGKGDFSRAERVYDAAIEHNNQKPEYFHNRASAIKRKGYQVVTEHFHQYYVKSGRITDEKILQKRLREYLSENTHCLWILRYLTEAIESYHDIVKKFPDYGKVHLSLATAYIELETFLKKEQIRSDEELSKWIKWHILWEREFKVIESYLNFIQAYEEGKFFFNPVVGGINQHVSGCSELETIILTSINYLSKDNKEECLKAFNTAQELHKQHEFWLAYAEKGRAFVNSQESFHSWLKLIDIENEEVKISNYLPDKVKQKIESNWINEKFDSVEGQFWKLYIQGGYALVKDVEKFNKYLSYVSNENETVKVSSWLPDDIKQKIKSNWIKEKLNSVEGQFWQEYSQGGYELVRKQEKFVDYLGFINYDCNTLTISNWVSDNLQEEIKAQWQTEKYQMNQNNRQEYFKRIGVVLRNLFLGTK